VHGRVAAEDQAGDRATSEPARSRTLPPPPAEEPSAEQIEGLKAVVKEHGYELLVQERTGRR
jgi:hypothetical protein